MSECQQLKTICRVVKNKENPYVIINKTCLHDPLLSMKAKGVLCYMLSMPDDWVFHREELVKHFSDGMTALRSALKELEEHGYLKITCHRERGRITKWETLVFESPALANAYMQPEVENPPMETEPVVNRTLLNTDTSNNERTNNNSKEEGDTIANKIDEMPANQMPDVAVSFLDDLTEWGISDKMVYQWLDTYGIERFKEAVTKTKSSGAENPGGYLRSVLENGWKDVKVITNARSTSVISNWI